MPASRRSDALCGSLRRCLWAGGRGADCEPRLGKLTTARDDDGMTSESGRSSGASGQHAARNEPILGHDAQALREDLTKEYFALVDIVGGFDGRVMTVKGWSVTLSLAGLGLGFQQGHFALFALAGATALAFWFIEGQIKTQQWRYYSRMRDIEIAHYHLNRVALPELGEVSAMRIDQQWSYKGDLPDWRNDAPWRRTPHEIRAFLFKPYRALHVVFPHAVAVVIGFAAPGLAQLSP